MRTCLLSRLLNVKRSRLYEVCENDNLKGQKDVVFVKVEDSKDKED